MAEIRSVRNLITLYPGSKQTPDTETEEDNSDTTSQYTEAGLLTNEVLLAIAEAESIEP